MWRVTRWLSRVVLLHGRSPWPRAPGKQPCLGGGRSATLAFTVRACDPALGADFTFSPPSPLAGQTTTFTANTGQGADGCGSLEFQWSVNGVVVKP